MSCGEIRTVWWAEAAIQSLFHRNILVTYESGGRRSGRRRSRRLLARFGKDLGRFGVRKRASWPARNQAVAESVPRRGQEGIYDLRVLFIKYRAGGIDKFTAGSHACGCFLEHHQLQFGQLGRNVILS